MRLVSNLIQARYRDQILFRPARNGNHAGQVLIRPLDKEPQDEQRKPER